MELKNISRIRSIGGSLVVTIPKEIVRDKSLSEGELVRIQINKPVIDGFGVLKGIESFTRKDRVGDREI